MKRNAVLPLTLGAALLLSACEEREVLLPGPREDIRAPFETETRDPARVAPDAAPANRSASAGLPAPRANASWAQTPASDALRPAHPALRTQPAIAWSSKIGVGNSRRYRISTTPVIEGGRVFTMDSQSQVAAVSASSGAVLWSRDVTPGSERSGSAAGGGLAVGGGKLFVTSGFGRVSALDPASGREIWTQKLAASATGAPTYKDGLLYLVAGDKVGWVLETETGRIRYQVDGTGDVSNYLGMPAPVVTGKYAIFGFGIGELRAVFRNGGAPAWESSVVGGRTGRALNEISDVPGDIMQAGGRLYAANLTGQVTAFELGSGERLWSAADAATGSIWPAGNSVYFVSAKNELVRLGAADGAPVWRVALPGHVMKRNTRRIKSVYGAFGPVVAGGRVWVASGDGVLRGFDPASGALAATVTLPAAAATAPVVAGGVMYVLDAKGNLNALR